MKVLGRVAEVWRYPVKSMAGEQLRKARLVGYGVEGDRLYAFESDGAPPGMLRMTGRERRGMLRYAARLGAGNQVIVRTPAGPVCEVGELDLAMRLTREEEPQTDVRPVALIGVRTVAALGQELGEALNGRRFRANFALDLEAGPFSEDGLVGRTLRLGEEAAVVVMERIPRCRFVTYDPADPLEAQPMFALMKLLERRHQGRAGVYAVVARPGVVRAGDKVWVS